MSNSIRQCAVEYRVRELLFSTYHFIVGRNKSHIYVNCEEDNDKIFILENSNRSHFAVGIRQYFPISKIDLVFAFAVPAFHD